MYLVGGGQERWHSLGQLVVGSFADLGCEPVACYVQGQRAPLGPDLIQLDFLGRPPLERGERYVRLERFLEAK